MILDITHLPARFTLTELNNAVRAHHDKHDSTLPKRVYVTRPQFDFACLHVPDIGFDATVHINPPTVMGMKMIFKD